MRINHESSIEIVGIDGFFTRCSKPILNLTVKCYLEYLKIAREKYLEGYQTTNPGPLTKKGTLRDVESIQIYKML